MNWNSTFRNPTKPMKRAGRIKSKAPKSTPIRASARGEDCTIQLPGVCNGNRETTVLCHSNKAADGKGMGLKASDERAAYGCSSCHDVIDRRVPVPPELTWEFLEQRFEDAIAWTQRILKLKGLVK